MNDKIRVGEMSEEQTRILRLLSPQERLNILVEAATSKRKSFARLRDQVDFNGSTYEVYPMERLDVAVQGMNEGKPVLVRRECAMCHYEMFDSPVRRFVWSDVCGKCEANTDA